TPAPRRPTTSRSASRVRHNSESWPAGSPTSSTVSHSSPSRSRSFSARSRIPSLASTTAAEKASGAGGSPAMPHHPSGGRTTVARMRRAPYCLAIDTACRAASRLWSEPSSPATMVLISHSGVTGPTVPGTGAATAVPAPFGSAVETGRLIRPVDERRHLPAGHVVQRTEHGVGGRIAAPGDAGCPEDVDIGLVDAEVVVREQVIAGTIGEAEAPDHERCHLRPGQLVDGAELVVDRRV